MIARRLLLLPLTWLGISLVVFLLLQFTPGGPAEARLAEWRESTSLDRETTERELRVLYGLDRPLFARYTHWLQGFARGDWGTSFRYGRPVLELIAERAALTWLLGVGALALAYLVGIPLGLWLVTRAGSRWSTGVRVALLTLHATPPFLLGLLLADQPRYLAVLLTYAAAALAGIALLARHALIDEKAAAYVAALRARGLGEWAVHRRLLPRALLPLAASFPQVLGYFLAGSVVVESVFDLQGLGRLSYEASLGRDYPVLMAIVLLLATAQLLASTLADVVMWFIDPRLHFGENFA